MVLIPGGGSTGPYRTESLLVNSGASLSFIWPSVPHLHVVRVIEIINQAAMWADDCFSSCFVCNLYLSSSCYPEYRNDRVISEEFLTQISESVICKHWLFAAVINNAVFIVILLQYPSVALYNE